MVQLADPDLERVDKKTQNQFNTRLKELTSNNLSNGPFVKAYRIGPLFSGVGDWEMAPGNLASILDKSVRPTLRDASDPRLLETWDLQIEMERSLQSDRDRANPDSDFNRNRLPRLLWQRADDQYLIGGRTEGLQTMLSLIQGNPEHPDATKWISALSKLIEAETAAQTTPEVSEAPESDASD